MSDELAEIKSLITSQTANVNKLSDAQAENVAAVSEVARTQTDLTTTLRNINVNLERGFKLGEAVVSLFGKITFVFLIVVLGLAGVIVYIAQIEVGYKDFHIRRMGDRPAPTQQLPAPAEGEKTE